jgi:hypothetical protein
MADLYREKVTQLARGLEHEESLHHFVRHAAKEKSIGLDDVVHRVTVQVFVRDHFPMIAAPVQCDVDGISKGSHCVSVSPVEGRLAESRSLTSLARA